MTRITRIAVALGALGLFWTAAPAAAQMKAKMTLDWILQGPQAPFVWAQDSGVFKKHGLELQMDAGQGSGATVTRIASGAYDVGFGDIAPLIRYNAQNPGKELLAVAVLYDATPLAAMSLKGRGITEPKHLVGKKVAAPEVDSGRQMFPAFAKATGIDPSTIQWQSVQAPLREPMLVRGEADAITGFLTSGLLSLKALGVKAEDVVVMKYEDFGVDLYGAVISTTPAFAERNPELIRALVKASIEAHQAAVADPAKMIAALKARAPTTNEAIELERLTLSNDLLVATRHARANGISSVDPARLTRTIAMIADAYGVAPPPADKVYTDRFLPPVAERRLP